MPEFVIRADYGHTATPSLRYFHADTHSFGDYEHATRYDHDPSTVMHSLTATVHKLSVEPSHPRDIDGYPYVIDDCIGAVRLTDCCAAATSVMADGGDLYCKSCYESVDWSYDGPARLAADDPDGPRGPITITLPTPDGDWTVRPAP